MDEKVMLSQPNTIFSLVRSFAKRNMKTRPGEDEANRLEIIKSAKTRTKSQHLDVNPGSLHQKIEEEKKHENCFFTRSMRRRQFAPLFDLVESAK